MNIIIAGGGIGGLTAAIALARSGHRVRVLEQAPEPKPVGAGISLQPNAMQAFATLDLDKSITERGCTSSIAQLRLSNGKSVQSMDFSAYLDRYGFLPHMIHRADLFDLLYQTATESGAEVQFGASLESFCSESQSVAVQTPATEFRCDALIGADGIHSKVRSGLFGQQPTRFSGYVCWRGIVTEPKIVSSVDTMNEIWGNGARFGFMRCSPDKVYWFATMTTANRERPSESWKEQFRDWPDPIHAMLDRTPESQIAFNDISDRRPIFPWSKGRVTLLGDAAHPMTPNFGQGGAQAIEDAIVLARAVNATNDPVTAFQSYEQHRHVRTKKFIDRSLQFGKVAQGGNRWWRMIRNHLIPRIPESVMIRQLDEQFDVQGHLNAELT